MKIREVIERVKHYHKDWESIDPVRTRDQILYGDAEQECIGIATTCWASMDVIKKAYALGANLIICHEALFWNHGDRTQWLQESGNTVFEKKKVLLDETGIVVWRDHDHIHSGIPVGQDYADGIFYGLAKKLGWENYRVESHSAFDSTMYILPETSVRSIAQLFLEKLSIHGVKLIGDMDLKVKKVFICMHVLGHDNEMIQKIEKEEIDLAISLEMVDFTVAEYMRDCMQSGEKRAVFTVGHFNTEEPGMEYMITYLSKLFPQIPSVFIPAGDMYQYLTEGM